jgi:peptidoglycan/xylan/chitin deacetylase (PgdA/CDA1 family)
MRRHAFFLVAGSATAAILSLSGVGYFLTSRSSQTVPDNQTEITTGTVDARWPKSDATPSNSVPALYTSAQPAEMLAPSGVKRAILTRPSCTNPNALGVSRTVQVDTTGGPGLGMSQYRDYDFLQPGEVVLTFDDGPWPVTTPAVLAALSAECVLAVFFPIGKHSTWHPEILKQVIAQGHTVGSHTWSHPNLASKTEQDAEAEIEKGISAVALMAEAPIAPFFRFPQLRQTAELKTYLGQRNITAFSIDIDSQDFKIHKSDAVVVSVMEKLKKNGKGIILMHDIHRWTADALPNLLSQLKSGGYKVVHIRAKDTLATLPEYDAAIAAGQPLKASSARPISSVVQTLN